MGELRDLQQDILNRAVNLQWGAAVEFTPPAYLRQTPSPIIGSGEFSFSSWLRLPADTPVGGYPFYMFGGVGEVLALGGGVTNPSTVWVDVSLVDDIKSARVRVELVGPTFAEDGVPGAHFDNGGFAFYDSNDYLPGLGHPCTPIDGYLPTPTFPPPSAPGLTWPEGANFFGGYCAGGPTGAFIPESSSGCGALPDETTWKDQRLFIDADPGTFKLGQWQHVFASASTRGASQWAPIGGGEVDGFLYVQGVNVVTYPEDGPFGELPSRNFTVDSSGSYMIEQGFVVAGREMALPVTAKQATPGYWDSHVQEYCDMQVWFDRMLDPRSQIGNFYQAGGKRVNTKVAQAAYGRSAVLLKGGGSTFKKNKGHGGAFVKSGAGTIKTYSPPPPLFKP